MEAVWLPHPGVWVTKGSSVPIALEGSDNQCSHSLETGPINCSHNMKWARVGRIMLCYAMFWHFSGFAPL